MMDSSTFEPPASPEVLSKCQFVVVGEHTLGIIDSRMPDVIQKLAISVLRGATFGSEYDNIVKPWPDSRPATRKDFDTFRIMSSGYERDPRYDFPIH